MKFFKITLTILLVVLVSSCACRTKPKAAALLGDGQNLVGYDGSLEGGNIPVAQAGGVLADIYFQYDSASLSSSARETLRENANWLQSNPEYIIALEGHCDERGTSEYNLALGQRRAQSVYDYIRSLGVDGGRMTTVSYGEDQPLDPSSNEQAWSLNRRVHFRIN